MTTKTILDLSCFELADPHLRGLPIDDAELSKRRKGTEWKKSRILEDYEKRDAAGIIMLLNNHEKLRFVTDNAARLQKDGFLEECLFEAWDNGHPGAIPKKVLKAMVDSCDREKLRKLGGDPPAIPVKVFRGCFTDSHHLNGFCSWTTELGCACWFATRHEHVVNKTVYEATIKERSQFAWYTNGRDETEFIANIPIRSIKTVEMSLKEMAKVGEKWKAELNKQQNAE